MNIINDYLSLPEVKFAIKYWYVSVAIIILFMLFNMWMGRNEQ